MKRKGRKLRSRSSANETFAQDILGFLKSSSLDDDAQYLQRGRPYGDLSDEEALAHWCTAFQIMAETFSDQDRRVHADLDSELRLRSIEPPYDRVREAFEKFVGAAKGKYQELEQDPDALLKRSEQIQQDFDAFKAARDRPKN